MHGSMKIDDPFYVHCEHEGLGLKWCNGCEEYKLIIKFHKHEKCYDGRASKCNSCRMLHKKYGIWGKDKKRMFNEQGGKCLKCTDPMIYDKSHVDHDHATGEVRSLLCHPCNLIIETVRDHELEVKQYLNRTHKEYPRTMGRVVINYTVGGNIPPLI
jgi:Recombination endonuclease VII